MVVHQTIDSFYRFDEDPELSTNAWKHIDDPPQR